MHHHYWLLRYVPDTVRGEFINIGVLVGGNGSWALRVTENWRAAERLGGDPRRAQSWLEQFHDAVELAHPDNLMSNARSETEGTPLSHSYMERIRNRYNNAVQISQGVPVATDNVDRAADLLFDRLVRRSKHEGRQRAKTRIVQNIRRDFLVAAEENDRFHFSSRAKAVVGRQAETFDFAIGQGKIRQLTHVWSFNVKEVEPLIKSVRSWSMVVSMLRHDGAVIAANRSGNRTSTVAPDVPVRVVYGPPQTTPQRNALADAQDLWRTVGVKAYSSDRLHEVVTEAQELVLPV